MIAVDTSALMAILLKEPEEAFCRTVIDTEPVLVISAATLAEALIVADRRNFGGEMRTLFDDAEWVIDIVDANTTARVADIYFRWGKGVHPASLNIIDCFAYDIARQNQCPLLYVGNDFAQTDVVRAV
jgi:ribonuclease VapC